MASRVFKATAAMMGVLHRILKLSIQVEGLENISHHPTLFVVNHFTRMETFIVPYVLYKHTDKELRSLADSSLFKGIFGEYLRRMGARSTREPLRNRTIIGDLASGRHDWVIFPEGVMVKSKKVMQRGKLQISHPRYMGRPHTGAAVLALKAELVRERFLEASRGGDEETARELADKYALNFEDCEGMPGLVITPVNITFYPLRPNDNALSRIACGIKPAMADPLVEELKTEGSLLLKNTDMTIYFSPPVDVQEYLNRPLSIFRRLPFLQEVQRENIVLARQRWPLTKRFMEIIYTTTAVNLDHLFCMGLRTIKTDYILAEDFHRALYLSALTIRENESRQVHVSLHNDLIKLIADEPHQPLEEIACLAEDEGMLVRENGGYRIVRRLFDEAFPHENVRLRGTTRVIANEIEPMHFVVKTVARYVNMASEKLRVEIVERVSGLDQQHFEDDYVLYYEHGLSKSPAIGRPFFMKSDGDMGVLLCHGYLAAPEEMRPLGEALHAAGYTVYGARLQGFGTGPEQLLDVQWTDWVISFNRAYAVLRNCCKRIILGGFSAGALLVLLNAARKQGAVESIFCIDTPLILMDRRACTLAPVALGWNRMMKKMHLPGTLAATLENRSETPDINYPLHYLEGVRELCKLIAVCRDALPDVQAPCLILHGSDDPIADPQSAEVVYDKIGSEVKEKVMVDADYHNLVQKEDREKVFQEVLRFVGQPHEDA